MHASLSYSRHSCRAQDVFGKIEKEEREIFPFPARSPPCLQADGLLLLPLAGQSYFKIFQAFLGGARIHGMGRKMEEFVKV